MPDHERLANGPAVAARAAAQLGHLADEFARESGRVDDARLEALLGSTAHLLSVLQEAFSDAREDGCPTGQAPLSPRTDVTG